MKLDYSTLLKFVADKNAGTILKLTFFQNSANQVKLLRKMLVEGHLTADGVNRDYIYKVTDMRQWGKRGTVILVKLTEKFVSSKFSTDFADDLHEGLQLIEVFQEASFSERQQQKFDAVLAQVQVIKSGTKLALVYDEDGYWYLDRLLNLFEAGYLSITEEMLAQIDLCKQMMTMAYLETESTVYIITTERFNPEIFTHGVYGHVMSVQAVAGV